MKPKANINQSLAAISTLADSWRHKPHGREESADAARVAREQRQVRHISVRADEKIRQWSRLSAACATVFLECLARLKRGVERHGKIGEGREPLFQFLLRVKLHREFGEDNGVVTNSSRIRPALDLFARPSEPFRVFGENVRDDAGVHQSHAVPRVWRSQLAVSPLTLPPRSRAASTRLPRVNLPALTTSTPSGWSTNSTSRRGNNPCRRRNAGGMVTWPFSVIFIPQTLPRVAENRKRSNVNHNRIA
jgi:hypothetical protein